MNPSPSALPERLCVAFYGSLRPGFGAQELLGIAGKLQVKLKVRINRGQGITVTMPTGESVTLTEGQTVTTIPQTSGAGACPANQPAWYYDVPSAPTRIDLCQYACDAVSAAGDGAQLNVVAGCTDTVIVVQ